MLTGTTASGFEFEIDDEKINDMRFVETLIELDNNVLKLPAFIENLLGPEQKERAYEFVKVGDRVPIDALSNLIGEILNTPQPIKK